MIDEGQSAFANWAIPLLPNEDFRYPAIFGIPVIHFIAVDEHHDIGVLLNRSTVPQITENRSLVGAIIDASIELREGQNGDSEFLC